MPLSERTAYFIGIHDDGQIELRKTRQIWDGSELIGEKHHRQVLEPGQKISEFPTRLQEVCRVVWTPEVIENFKTAKAEQDELNSK